MTTRRPRLVLGSVTLVLFAAVHSFAGGPLILRAPGAPFLWPNGGTMIPFNPDQGGLGPLTNAQAVAQTTLAFQRWGDIASSSATHTNRGLLPVDVDETNFVPFFAATAPDGLSAIVYDEDGAIFTLLFGANSGVLGFAGPEFADAATGDIIEGLAFMNGGVLGGTNPFPVAEMLSVQVHEFGHYQNLAHTVVNGQILAGPDSRGPSPFNTFPPPVPSFANRIETMYPFLFINGGQATVHADDIAIFSTLYPEPSFGLTTGSVKGTILTPNNQAVTGVNVIARNIANPYDDAISAISSDFTDNFGRGRPFVGEYALRGLTPGASYAIYVDEILVGGFSTPPRRPLPGPEEFYNGPLESSDAGSDPPNVFTPVIALAGVTVSDIDIIFNRRPPGPITAGNDTMTEIFPEGFTFDFCGTRYDSFVVNSNGSVSFGTGSTDFTETIQELLTGPPRIAALWDDLNAATGGTVSFEQAGEKVTVIFTNVPEFPNVGANSFQITLFGNRIRLDDDDEGDDEDDRGRRGRFTLSYGDVSAQDGIAGFSCGGRVTSGFETETDLSALVGRTIGNDHTPAVFEAFTATPGDNDLDNRTLTFEAPRRFRDRFEPNDSPVIRGDDEGDQDEDDEDEFVELPFDTADRFSEIDAAGGDLDFFRFRVKAGDIIAIETVPGRQAMDTVLGLFNEAGELLLADDDAGVGTLSKLIVQFNADGNFSVGVSTFPDLDFSGDGADSGRYVLSIRRYRGTVLNFGNDPLADASVQVGLSTFTFPFQGTNYSSVFVNENGNLTFGAASADFTETVPEFLAGPPRIAPLWDDLNTLGGFVIAEEKNRALQIHFVSVPEFFVTGTNYFSVKLDRSGDITFDYGATNRSDGIVGITQGGGAADPGPIDISRAFRLSATGTTFERFGPPASFAAYGGVDLSFRKVEFRPPRR